MTKHLARQPLDKCMLQLNQHRTAGRASAGLDVQGKKSAPLDPSPSSSAGDRIEVGQRKQGSEIKSNSLCQVGSESAGDDVASDATDPGMPPLHALVTPTAQSAHAALARLNAKARPPKPPASGRTATHLGSLRICSQEPPAAQDFHSPTLQAVSLRTDEELDRPTIFQAEGQRHKRLCLLYTSDAADE